MATTNLSRGARVVRVVAHAVLAIMASLALAGPAPAADKPYASLVEHVGEVLSVNPDVIHSVISAESSYMADAKSHAGALGLMQIIPETGGRDAYRFLYGCDAIPTDASVMRPEVNIWLGAGYLRLLDTEYFAWIEDPDVRMRAVLVGYNWGPTRVLEKLLPGREVVSVDEFERRIQAQAPLETQGYVHRVLKGIEGRTVPILASR